MAKEQERHGKIMTVQDICRYVADCCVTAERHAEMFKQGRDDRTLDYWLGFLHATDNGFTRMLWCMNYEDLQKECGIQRFENEAEAEKYAYDEEWVATSYDEALNKLYRDSGMTTEIVVEGNTYHSHIVPFGFIKVNGEIYPVFDDDAGQSEYIRIGDENFGAGAYNFQPEEYFIARILREKVYDAELKIKNFYTKGE